MDGRTRMRSLARKRPRGFTLVELMIVTAIVGVLASVAIPTFQRMTYRSRASERGLVMRRVRAVVQDHLIRTGYAIPAANAGFVWSDYNPPWPPTMVKRPMLNTIPGWNAYFGMNGQVTEQIQGTVSYAYMFMVLEWPGGGWIQVSALGDLDGDGQLSQKDMYWNLIEGSFDPDPALPEWPPAGSEDDVTFGTF